MAFTGDWIGLEITMLSERSQSHKDKFHMMHFLLFVEAKEKQSTKQQDHESIRRIIKEAGRGKEKRDRREDKKA
jgi:hypothetical protein